MSSADTQHSIPEIAVFHMNKYDLFVFLSKHFFFIPLFFSIGSRVKN